MAILNLGRVRGIDGVSPEITVEENSLNSYRLRVKTATDEFVSPNLRGSIFKAAVVEILGQDTVQIPFGDLGLNADKDYTFCASPGIDYPLLRNIVAVRIGNAVRITIYTDTLPYTEPQTGSPFRSGIRLFGDDDALLFGADDAYFGGGYDGESFPVNLLCAEQ